MDHPVAKHLMGVLRNVDTGPNEFRSASDSLAYIALYHATFDLSVEKRTITTPIENCTTEMLTKKIVVVPILRAGQSMVEAALRLFPDVSIGYVGLERSHETAIAHRYYLKLPDLRDREVILVDPMLATGGSASQAVTNLFEQGADSIRVVTIVAAPEGVQRLNADHPSVNVYTVALDRELNEHKYIMPGLGDFGDRFCDT